LALKVANQYRGDTRQEKITEFPAYCI